MRPDTYSHIKANTSNKSRPVYPHDHKHSTGNCMKINLICVISSVYAAGMLYHLLWLWFIV